MPEFAIVPWTPPPLSSDHVSRCDALRLPHRTDLRRAGDVDAWGVGELPRGAQCAAHDDVAWTRGDGARHSLRELVRASGHDPVSPEYRTACLAVRDWSLSPSGRHLAALVQHGKLAHNHDGKHPLGFLVVDTRSGAVEAVEVERESHNPSLLRACLVDDDTVVVASWQGLALFQRTSHPAGVGGHARSRASTTIRSRCSSTATRRRRMRCSCSVAEAPEGWQATQKLAVRAHAHVVAHPGRPWFYLWTDQEVSLYGLVGEALKKLGATRLTAPGERRRSIVQTDGARVGAPRGRGNEGDQRPRPARRPRASS